MRRSAHLAILITSILTLAAGAARAQTVDDIVAKNLKAKGGLEKIKSISSVKMTGSMTIQGNDAALTVWSKRPNLFRREIEVQGQKIVQAFDGKTMWMINPMMGAAEPQEIPAAQAKSMQADADFDGVFVDYKDKGTTIELVGTEKLDGKDVYHLKVTPKGGEAQQYYLDAATGLEYKVTRSVEQGGTKMNIETQLGDYKEVNGMTVPFATTQFLNGSPIAKVSIQNVEFNAPVDEAQFKMPAK